ncbi:MAG TPA: primosomal protein N' [Patescibacteria group bacterium]|nr:primosomal protein N' [Patescibacteria group bacterium]
MQYIEVLVSDPTFHGNEPLTYSSNLRLEPGALVIVPLRQKQVLGVVVGASTQPQGFAVKHIIYAPDVPPLPPALLALLEWMRGYYPAPLGVLTQLFMPNKQLPKKPSYLSSAEKIEKSLPPLSPDQQKALSEIKTTGMHLLHGATGSGKTRIYIELAKRSLSSGRSAIILTPEIGLTSQLDSDFRAALGDRVVILHSQLTDVTRQRIWQALLEQTEPVVVIGARSALFSPLKNVGLIAVDESHETAYKQDQAPYYHATTVAAKLASLHKATIVLGSATPLVTDYYIALAKQRPIIRMLQNAKSSDFLERSVSIVDLRDRAKFTKSPHISNELINGIEQTLTKKEQALVFLNRRGTARIIFCDSCGWQAVCPHCDLPLVYHADSHIMRCHSCDFKSSCPVSCPSCGNASVIFKSIGTKAIASELEKLFPDAKIMRFDTDNKKDERIEQHYDAIKRGDVDILVGTQTLAKGLDLPRLSLVGVAIADTGLYFPDFSAQERTYQLLAQVIGRVGRGHREGHAIVQTYSPDSPLLKSILSKNWQEFYEKEITERKIFHFPPFCYILKLSCRRASSASAQRAAISFVQKLQDERKGITIEGPAPSFHEKVQNKYAWQIIIKSNNRQLLVNIIQDLPSGWSYDIDPMNLL